MTDRPGDPADKATDATADGAFGGVTNHRAGYGDDRLERLIEYLRLHPTATLASGEGGMLVQHILLLRARIEGMSGAAKDYEDHYADARAEIDRLTRTLAADVQWLRQMLADYRIPYDDHPVGRRIALNVFIHSLRQRADRAERILSALREPSYAVIDAAALRLDSGNQEEAMWAIRTAVAAAEQEVGSE